MIEFASGIAVGTVVTAAFAVAVTVFFDRRDRKPKPRMRTKNVKYMDPAEFRAAGYLHEVNRRILHPLGLAIQMDIRRDGGELLGGIWDCRDEGEGLRYGEDLLSPQKAAAIATEWAGRRDERIELLGYMVQPVKGGDGPLD
jgi:hypothetical protein